MFLASERGLLARGEIPLIPNGEDQGSFSGQLGSLGGVRLTMALAGDGCMLHGNTGAGMSFWISCLQDFS